MDGCHIRSDCQECPGHIICHCLQITEDMLRDAVGSLDLRSIQEVANATGAGSACTACRRQLRHYLEQRRELTVVPATS
jgi:bacterioferritin-associated ferredoxin